LKYLLSPMPGLLTKLMVQLGQQVKAGEDLAVIEAMKMENVLRADLITGEFRGGNHWYYFSRKDPEHTEKDQALDKNATQTNAAINASAACSANNVASSSLRM